MRFSRQQPSLITIANERVSIISACRMAGVELPDGPAYGWSMKVFCPFGLINHSDGGMEKAMRVYVDSNHAWCFACHAFYTPVKMVALARQMDWVTTAGVLLESIGYRAPSDVELFQEMAEQTLKPDSAQLADALKQFCRRVIPQWRTRQFDREEAALLDRCLRLLDQVRTDEEAQLWLNTAKTVMSREFAGPHSCTNQK